MKGLVTRCIVILIGVCIANAEQLSRTCDVNVAFSLPLVEAKVSDLRFISQPYSSNADFWFTNDSQKAVVGVTALIDLRDKNNQHIFSMLFHAFEPGAYRENTGSAATIFPVNEAIEFQEPLRYSEKRLWSAHSPFFTEFCPASSRATLAVIQYQDGSESKYSDNHEMVRRDAVITDAPPMDLRGAPFEVPFEAWATIQVEKTGTPLVVDVEGGREDIKEWLQNQIEHWSFSPALLAETPIQSTLKIWFRFHRAAQIVSPSIRSAQGMVYQVADVIPAEQGKQFWRVFLGQSPISTKGVPNE